MKKLALIIFFLFALFIPITEAKQVTVTGQGVTASAAENDALRQAVEKAVGVLVDSQSLVSKNILIEDNIYTNSRGFITNYTVVDKRQDAVGSWRVTVNADVDESPNSKLMNELTRLGIIDTRLRNPKIAVYIPESHIQYRVPDPAGETAVIKTLVKAGFSQVIAASPKLTTVSYNWARKGYNVNLEDLRAAARFFSADIVIMGEAFSEGVGDPGQWLPGNQRMNMRSCRARVEAKMYLAKTGQIIAADGKYGSALDISEAVASKKALAAAGEEIGNYFVDEILKYSSSNRQNTELIVISSDFSKINKVQAALKSIRGVKNVQMKNYASGKGVFEIQYSGAPQTLYRELASSVDTALNLISASYNTLTVGVS
ncbi:MAG: hypothetical protein J6I62_10405 [Selenomonadaceae bacterium]|nr:hypothetical protein [Selenomonadaceae bacterium]MBP3723649.1 hypothetical protein [Selenomonadaceae bacterium]